MLEKEQITTELSSIVHELNNVINTLNGYSELMAEARSTGNEEELTFYRDKLAATAEKKLVQARSIASRLTRLNESIIS